MRRKLNKKSIFVILLIALFTLLSYSFDQLVIRQEDKLRNSQITLENHIVELDNYESVNYQLFALSDLILNEFINLKRVNKYWLKAIFLNSETKDFKKLQGIKSINNFINTDTNMIYLRNAQHLRDVIVAHNVILDKYENIYWWNKNIFKNDVFILSIEDIFDKNKSDLKIKDIGIYYDIANPDKRDEIIYNLTIDNWFDIYKLNHSLVNELLKYHFYINSDTIKIENYIEKVEKLRDQEVINLSKISTNKNYFILSSIISQIISLLFLLILFRILIDKSNKS